MKTSHGYCPKCTEMIVRELTDEEDVIQRIVAKVRKTWDPSSRTCRICELGELWDRARAESESQ